VLPLETFFRNPERTGYSISPDGNYVAYLAPWEKRMNVYVEAVDGQGGERRLTNEIERDIAGFFWKGTNYVLYLRDNQGDENYVLYRTTVDGGETMPLTPLNGVLARVVDDLEDDPLHMLVGINERNPQVFDIYKYNIVTGAREMVLENPGYFTGYVADHNGQLRYGISADGVNVRLFYRENNSEAFRPILETDFRQTFQPIYFDADNRSVYAVDNRSSDKARLVRIRPETAEVTEVVYENPRYDVSNIKTSPKSKKVVAVTYSGAKPERVYLDPRYKQIQDKIDAQLPGVVAAIVDWDKAEKYALVRTYSDRTLGSYYLYTVASNELRELSKVSPWLNPEEMAEMIPIRYKSRDGLEIEGYLSLPPHKQAQKLPVIIHPHGGPWARDEWGFNQEVQFLANRGYAVLQMNFRGSTGYGRKFWEASFGQWGLKMQDDITDGVEWLKKLGIADPNRIGIFGASYGGYATLAGVAFTPKLYKCGVDYVGVSNLFTFMESVPPYWEPFRKMMYEMVGNPVTDSLRFRQTSPVFHADKIKVPIFIAQGAKDPRVNQMESEQIVQALKANNVPYEYLLKEDEGHGFRKEENRFEFYRAMEAFLRKYL
jgi:dipeptidyl aminopeptidase/acylaminoacyl peptidase